MSYVAPEVREKFESLSIGLKNLVLEKKPEIYNIYDLISALESIVNEEETENK